ncbi:mannose-1-phosphate guanylyltransferase/mannose-6-phosphate isomerase [Halodesulfovibrio aestuarii]|uniref:mannose-1-phosphate guanylyltransferase/mannose-6-phosphate isomerase n=1 Tax=Halodesulfovibrio aestuarii TaxID=126333 RepID=UPI003D3506D9
MIVPVILSGGSGTRLWPISRGSNPKQLMHILDNNSSLLQQTIDRANFLTGSKKPIVVTNEKYRFMIASQIQEVECNATIILEPSARDTAPALAAAATHACIQDDDPILLVLPADHLITNKDAFKKDVEFGASYARDGKLITFGVTPDRPETGYGYIKKGEAHKKYGREAFSVSQFTEKPNEDRAQRFFESGQFVWNSGMFMFKASTYLNELKKFHPDITTHCNHAMSKAQHDLDFLRLEAHSFEKSPAISIDYAVMEKTKKAIVIPVKCGWSDIGSWSALHDISEKDTFDNVCIGDVIAENISGCYLHSTNRMIAALGLEDLAIIETKDAILAAPLDKVQDIKLLVNKLKKEDREEAELHCKVFRPWGNYESIDLGGRYQVKRITVYPGQTLSLQKHFHRAEHWVVVKGTAVVTKDKDQIVLSENQSTYIPLGTIHRLENPGKVNLELIEIQSGCYLGEDDIVRYEDIYGRSEELAS